MNAHACCAPGREPSGEEAPAPESANDAATDGMIRLGGSFLMGTEDPDGFPQQDTFELPTQLFSTEQTPVGDRIASQP